MSKFALSIVIGFKIAVDFSFLQFERQGTYDGASVGGKDIETRMSATNFTTDLVDSFIRLRLVSKKVDIHVKEGSKGAVHHFSAVTVNKV